MVLAVFRVRYHPHADRSVEAQLGGQLYGLVSQIPGFISIKDFQSADGEVVNLVEFATREALDEWKDHPEHLKAKLRHGEFYHSYQLQICDVLETYGTGTKS